MLSKRLAVLASATLLLSACGGESDPQAKGEGCEPQTLTVAMAGLGNLIHVPVYVAKEAGYFKDAGFDVKMIDGEGGANAAAIVLSGEAQAGALVSDHTLRLSSRGQSLPITVPLTTRLSQQFVLDKKIAEERGITEEQSVEQRFSKLKGISVGITSPGSSTDNATRYLFTTAGLNPDKDVEIVPLSSTSDASVAFENGDVDAFSASPPYTNAVVGEGKPGVVIADFLKGEVEGLDDVIYSDFALNKQWAEDHHDCAVAATGAVLKALDLMEKDPEKAKDLVYETDYSETVERDVFDLGWESVSDAYPTAQNASLDKAFFTQTADTFLKKISGEDYKWKYEDVALPDVLKEAQGSIK